MPLPPFRNTEIHREKQRYRDGYVSLCSYSSSPGKPVPSCSLIISPPPLIFTPIPLSPLSLLLHMFSRSSLWPDKLQVENNFLFFAITSHENTNFFFLIMVEHNMSVPTQDASWAAVIGRRYSGYFWPTKISFWWPPSWHHTGLQKKKSSESSIFCLLSVFVCLSRTQ